jgi:glycerol kinase
MVTAAFHSISFQTKEITSILQEYDIQITNLSVDGGMVKNNSFCQLLADTLNKKIIQPKNVESTAIGACKVCMLASGLSINNSKKDDMNVFTPNTELTKTYYRAFNDWKSYVEKSLTTS